MKNNTLAKGVRSKVMCALLAFAMVIMMPILNVSVYAGDGDITVTSDLKEWSTSGTYVVNDDVTIDGTVTISADVKLVIAEGKTLTVVGTKGKDNAIERTKGEAGSYGIQISSGSLIIDSKGILDITGGAGGNGQAEGSSVEGYGGAGGIGMYIPTGSAMTIKSGTVSVSGGTGGIGEACDLYDGYSGAGGDGLSASNSSVVVNGGSLIVNAGAGGTGGERVYPGSPGEGCSGALTVNNGLVKITGENNAYKATSDNELKITGGTVQFDGGLKALEICYNGKTTVTGGTVQLIGKTYALDNTGTLNINGGQIYTDGDWFNNDEYGTIVITAGLFNTDVTSRIDTNSYKCIANADPATKDKYGYIVLPRTHYQLISASNLTGQGGVNFIIGSSAAATAEKGVTVTATAIPVEGYDATLLSSDVTISNEGTFTMPEKAVVVKAKYVKDISSCTVAEIKAQTYTGKQITLEPVITDGTKTLVKDKDYTVTYGTNINVGTDAGTITITGKDNYSGTREVKFDITKAEVKPSNNDTKGTTDTGDSNDITLFVIMGILALCGAGFVYKRREN